MKRILISHWAGILYC